MSFTDAISDKPASGLEQLLAKNIGDTQKNTEEVSSTIDKATATKDAAMAKADKEESKLDPNALKPPDIQPFQAPAARSPLQAFGSAAGVLAALGGLLTRHPLTTSLEASAKVMNAYQQQDAAAAQTAFTEWKANNDNAIKLADFELKSYQEALSKVDTDKRAAMADFQATAAAMQNKTAALVAQHFGLQAAVQYVDDMQQHVDKMKELAPKLEDQNEKMQLFFEWQKANPAPPKDAPPEVKQKYINDMVNMHNKIQDPSVAAAEIRASMLGGAATKKLDEQVSALQSLKTDTAALSDMITADPSLIGTKGVLRRSYQSVVGQTTDDAAHDKQVADVKARILTLQARLIPVINARYFSGPAAKKAEELVPGLGKFDDPTTVLSSLEELDRILDQDISTKKQSSGMVNQNLKDLSDEDILNQLGVH